MITYYLEALTHAQTAYLRRKYETYSWNDGSVNVEMTEEQVDTFVEWCEGQGIEPKLL